MAAVAAVGSPTAVTGSCYQREQRKWNLVKITVPGVWGTMFSLLVAQNMLKT